MIRDWDTAFFSFSVTHVNKVPSSNSENDYISASEPKLKKTKGTLFSRTLKVEGNKVPFVFSIFDQGLRYGQSKNFEVFPFDVAYWIMSTLEAALPDWFGQKYLARCLKYQNGMGLTWELINPRNFDFLCPPTVHACTDLILILMKPPTHPTATHLPTFLETKILCTCYFCHTRLHHGFLAKLRIWQVSACKMKPR